MYYNEPMSNHPAYRNRVPPGQHPNWCRCAGCRRDVAEFESRQFKGTMAMAAAVIAISLIIVAAEAIAHAIH